MPITLKDQIFNNQDRYHLVCRAGFSFSELIFGKFRKLNQYFATSGGRVTTTQWQEGQAEDSLWSPATG